MAPPERPDGQGEAPGLRPPLASPTDRPKPAQQSGLSRGPSQPGPLRNDRQIRHLADLRDRRSTTSRTHGRPRNLEVLTSPADGHLPPLLTQPRRLAAAPNNLVERIMKKRPGVPRLRTGSVLRTPAASSAAPNTFPRLTGIAQDPGEVVHGLAEPLAAPTLGLENQTIGDAHNGTRRLDALCRARTGQRRPRRRRAGRAPAQEKQRLDYQP